METFGLFLNFLTLLLSLSCLVLIYLAIDRCRESEFVPLYYFIALSAGGVMALSVARVEAIFWGNGIVLSSSLLQDLLISYVALFIFGSIWQSHEAELCMIPLLGEE